MPYQIEPTIERNRSFAQFPHVLRHILQRRENFSKISDRDACRLEEESEENHSSPALAPVQL